MLPNAANLGQITECCGLLRPFPAVFADDYGTLQPCKDIQGPRSQPPVPACDSSCHNTADSTP